ncbi:MAG: glycosyltransferase [Bacteroidetes bacterium]|nr:glycosyltransferase [Bacteroidota bacterium]
MKKHRIVFRADGDLIAGYGHVIRSLSLASILKSKYHCVFIIREPDQFLKQEIEKICSEIVEVPKAVNYNKEASQITKKVINTNDIVILDGYHFDSKYQLIIKKSAYKVVCIDDIYDRHFTSDIVINHSEGIKESNYSREFYTKLYLGSKYAILRKSFLTNAKRELIPETSEQHVFISMGGTDQKNFTEKALTLCLKQKNITAIDIVVGSFYAHLEELKVIISRNKNIKIKIHSNLNEKEISSLMKKSTFGICSASTVSYEYSCTGGILFLYQTVSNQKKIFEFLIKTGSAFPAEDLNKKSSLLNSKKLKTEYFNLRKHYFSGNSAENLEAIFSKIESERGISIRKAAISDLQIYFKWANDPEVRHNSINTSQISLEGHNKWFKLKLKNKTSILYVIEKSGIAIGQVRLDKDKNGWEIDYSIAKQFRGKGFGEIILRNAILQFRKKHMDKIIGKVKQSNVPSCKVFDNLNFVKSKTFKIENIVYNMYTLE